MPNSIELDADEIATGILDQYAKDDVVHKKVSDMALAELRLRQVVKNEREYVFASATSCCPATVVVGCTNCAWMRQIVRRLDAALAGKEPPHD